MRPRHRTGAAGASGIEPARGVTLVEQDAERARDERPRRRGRCAVSSRRTTGTPAAGGSMSMPAASIILGIEPRLAMPMPAQAVQSSAMPRVPLRRSCETLLHSRSLAAA